MGRLLRIDGDKVRNELKSAEKSLKYWMDLKANHPKGNTFFDQEIFTWPVRKSMRLSLCWNNVWHSVK